MKIRFLHLKPVSTFIAAASLLIAGAASAQDCVSFQGIDHCPIGKSSLRASQGGLSVANNGDGAGVSSRFQPTVFWNSHMEIAGGMQHSTALSSISGGETTSRLFIEPEGDTLRLRSEFTGASGDSTYSVLIYRDGVLQGSLGNLSGGGSSATVADALTKRAPNVGNSDIIADPMDEWFYLYWWLHFFISPMGGCNWGIGMDAAVSFLMPDGSTVVGDEIRFSEDIAGSGHYPYLGFEAIDTVSTASSLRITEELAEGTR